MKSGKRQMTEGTELPNQERIRTPREKETYKYLEILKTDIIKQAEMKEKIKKEYLRRIRKLLETTNLIKKALPSRKIPGTILKVDEKRTSRNGPENKKMHCNA